MKHSQKYLTQIIQPMAIHAQLNNIAKKPFRQGNGVCHVLKNIVRVYNLFRVLEQNMIIFAINTLSHSFK